MKLNGVELPIGLRWSDEFDWSPIAQDVTYSLTGKVILQEGERKNWRPVTLTGGMNFSPITRGDLITLAESINSATSSMILTLNDDSVMTVYPDRSDGNPLVCKPYPLVLDSAAANPNDDVMYYIEQIKFATFE